MATRPAPPYIFNFDYTSPPTAIIHPGDSISWNFSIGGGKPSDQPAISADSLSPASLSKTGLQVVPVDSINRQYKLTAQTISGQPGKVEIKLSVNVGMNVKAETNLFFDVVTLGPPTLTLQSTPPLILESGRDSLVLPFTIADEKIDPEKLAFSAIAAPVDRISCSIQDNGSRRIITISRVPQASGQVSLAVRVQAGDRETVQTYDIQVEPHVTPPPAIDLTAMLKKARELWLSQQYNGALELCQQVINQDPQSVEAWAIKGTSLYSLKNYQEALAACKTTLKLDQRHLEAWFIKAASEEKLGMYHQALESYREYLSLSSPGDPLRPQITDKIQMLSRTN